MASERIGSPEKERPEAQNRTTMTTTPCVCPACRVTMRRENFGNVFVDVCDDGCRSIWFDGDELLRLDHERKGGGPALREALAAVEGAQAERPLKCPRCADEMDTIEYELQQSVTIDCCPECTGVFLDAGEIARIRSRELTDDEAQKLRGRFRRRRDFRRRRLDREEAQRRNSNYALIMMALASGS